jgi:hypothetical protein
VLWRKKSVVGPVAVQAGAEAATIVYITGISTIATYLRLERQCSRTNYNWDTRALVEGLADCFPVALVVAFDSQFGDYHFEAGSLTPVRGIDPFLRRARSRSRPGRVIQVAGMGLLVQVTGHRQVCLYKGWKA